EVGAGTGSASEILLQLMSERGLLPRLERYLITEPNAYFRRCSQRKLTAQYPNLPLEWAPLDVDSPWNSQGIPSGEFDIVYAVNVMHISKDLLFSLREARMALVPDSWLVIGECVRPYDNQPIYPELMFQILNSFTNVQTDPDNRRVRSEHWSRCSEAAAVPDHTLLCDHGTCRTSDVSRILEARAWRFSPLVACFPPFLLLLRDNSGSRLSAARSVRALRRDGS